MRHALIVLFLVAAGSAATAQEAPTGTWTARPDGTTNFGGGGSCTDGTYFYMFGGQAYDGTNVDSAPTRYIRRYDPATGTWTNLADLPYQVTYNTGAYYNGVVYSFSTLTYPPMPDATPPPAYPITKYSIATNTWTTSATTVARHGYYTTAATIGSKIYLAGGYDTGVANFYLDTCSEFDPSNDALVAKAAMPQVTAYATSAALNGKLYVFGGSTRVSGTSVQTDAVHEYDPATDSWATKAPMAMGGAPAPRRHANAFALEGRLYVAGGRYSSGGVLYTYNHLLEYNPGTDEWKRRADFAIPRYGAAVAVISGKAYLYGGAPLTGGANPARSLQEYTAPDFGSAPQVANVEQRVGATMVPQGGNVYTTVTFAVECSDPDAGQQVELEVQVKRSTDPDWSLASSHTSGPVATGTVTIVKTIAMLGGYDWRWRLKDTMENYAGGSSAWNDFSDPAVSPDFTSVTAPPPPSSGGGSGGGGGGCGGSATGSTAVAPVLLALLAAAAWIARKN